MSTKTSKLIKQLVLDIKRLILEEKTVQATTLALQGLSISEHQFLTEVRKNGVLRCSSYDFQCQKLKPLVDKILLENILSENARSYLESVKQLITVGRSIQKIFKQLVQEIEQGKFKSYLVSLDALFWEISLPNTIDNNSKELDLSQEQLATAFSFLFFQAKEKNKLDDNQLNDIDVKGIRKRYFLKKLSNFHKITEFRETEILVDFFNYKVTRENNRFLVEAPDEKLEMSISLGYINSQNQHIADSVSTIMEKMETGRVFLTNTALELAVQLKDELFQIKNSPTKRIVLKFSLSHDFAALIGNTKLFAEEEMIIELISKELFIDFNQIEKIEFYKNLSLFDIIKFQRFFVVLFHAFFAYIKSENLTNSKLFWRSILPVFKKDEFLGTIEHFFGKVKAPQLLEILSWSSASKSIFDIQYHPVLNIDEGIITPLGIISKSHLTRNLLQSTRYRFDSESSDDPVGKILEESLQSKSFLVQRNFPYSYKDRKAEIDVVATIDNHLFVFECKNSLHPTSPFELRTSYDYIKKGAEQLSYFSNFWQEKEFREYIASKLKIKDLTELHTCIVTGNRIFSGWKEQGHSIRTIYEIQNFINSGNISAQLLDLDEKSLDTQAISLWKSNTFSVNDLVNYIENDSLHNLYFESMIKKESETSFGNVSIIQYKYDLNATQFLQKVSNNFRLITNNN